jgi:hypothetical protein
MKAQRINRGLGDAWAQPTYNARTSFRAWKASA